MEFTIKHGGKLDTVTPAELETALARTRARDATTRVRAAETVKLDATGAGEDEVFTPPPGFEFEARRVTLDLDTAADPNTGNVALNVAARAVEYLRSGTRIEYAAPISPNAVPQVPGVQTWGAEQGPYLRNGETFQVRARGLTANATLVVTLEGILRRPPVKSAA